MLFLCAASRASLIATALLLVHTSTANAQALDVDGPDIEKGERDLRNVNGVNSGWRPGSAGEPRNTHKLAYSYSPTDWLRLVAHAEVTNVIVDDWRADHAALESFIALRKAEETGVAISWYTSVQVALDDDGTSSVLFGPIIRIGMGKTSLTGNQLFEETYGRSSSPGINAVYGWQLKHEISETFAIGVEWFGAVENIGDAPRWGETDQRFGPSVYFTRDVGEGRKWGLDIGVFAGLTDAAPDVTFKVNTGLTFK